MTVLRPRERRESIVHLTATGLADVTELADHLQVSPSTIRRDLAYLQSHGRLRRTYGGAIATDPHGESSLRQRIGEAFEEKQAIARWAAAQVQPGESLVLDAGSTVAALGHQLRNRSALSITTTSLAVLEELKGAENLTVRCLGGTLRPASSALVGSLTQAGLSRMTFDRAFLGADSVDAAMGICEADLEQVVLKELMGDRARHVYVLAHGEKLGRRPFHAWARMAPSWTLVTTAPPEVVAPFTAAGIRVVVVDGVERPPPPTRGG